MENYNVRKTQILETLYKYGELTAKDIWSFLHFEIGIKNIMVLLKRYHSFGYLHREKNENKVFTYSINKTGIKKLNYLLNNQIGLKR